MHLLSRKVTKHNHLVEASYRLSLNEQRLLLAAIACLDSRKPLPDQPITIKATDFADTFDLERRHAYDILKDAVDSLYERDIRTKNYGDKTEERTRWVTHAKYHNDQGFVTLHFAPKVVPLLTKLHKLFTSYELKHIARFTSIYAIRLYELAKQYQSIGYRNIGVDVLRDYLELGEQYDRFSNLKARVIDPALKEINATSDLSISYKVERKERTAVQIRFTIETNNQTALALA